MSVPSDLQTYKLFPTSVLSLSNKYFLYARLLLRSRKAFLLSHRIYLIPDITCVQLCAANRLLLCKFLNSGVGNIRACPRLNTSFNSLFVSQPICALKNRRPRVSHLRENNFYIEILFGFSLCHVSYYRSILSSFTSRLIMNQHMFLSKQNTLVKAHSRGFLKHSLPQIS